MNDFGAKMKRPAGTGLFQGSNMDGSATTTNCFYFSTSPAGFQDRVAMSIEEGRTIERGSSG